MSTFNQIQPSVFGEIASGRGAWRSRGFDFTGTNYVYRLEHATEPRLGQRAERDCDHWAVGAGSGAVQRRLVTLAFTTETEMLGCSGIWGPRTDAAFRKFQSLNIDPGTGLKLTVDGQCGRQDTRALWTPLIDAYEDFASIPDHLLRGLLNNESILDPGAVGEITIYVRDGGIKEYRGVDRGLAQINSMAHPEITWAQAFDAPYAISYAAARLRSTFDSLKAKYPSRADSVHWDAAVESHNSPVWGQSWAKYGFPPNDQAITYVRAVKNAIY